MVSLLSLKLATLLLFIVFTNSVKLEATQSQSEPNLGALFTDVEVCDVQIIYDERHALNFHHSFLPTITVNIKILYPRK